MKFAYRFESEENVSASMHAWNETKHSISTALLNSICPNHSHVPALQSTTSEKIHSFQYLKGKIQHYSMSRTGTLDLMQATERKINPYPTQCWKLYIKIDAITNNRTNGLQSSEKFAQTFWPCTLARALARARTHIECITCSLSMLRGMLMVDYNDDSVFLSSILPISRTKLCNDLDLLGMGCNTYLMTASITDFAKSTPLQNSTLNHSRLSGRPWHGVAMVFKASVPHIQSKWFTE